MRTILLILLSLILIPSLLATVCLGTANMVLSESFIMDTIEESGLFGELDQMVKEMLVQDMESAFNQQMLPLLPRLDFSPIIEDVGIRLVEKSFSFMDGRRDNIELVIDFEPLLGQIESLVMDRDVFISMIESQDPEMASLLQNMSDDELAEFQQPLLDEFVAAGNMPQQLKLDILDEFIGDDAESAAGINRYRSVFAARNWIVLGAVLLCLALIALMLFIRLTGGLGIAGASLLSSGILLRIGTAAADRIYSRWSACGEVSDAVLDMLDGVMERLLSFPQDIGAAGCFVGLVFIAIALLTFQAGKVRRAELARAKAKT